MGVGTLLSSFFRQGEFPPEFDGAFYRKRHRDLRHLSDEQLVDHYEKCGRSEGRLASRAVPRKNFIPLLSRYKSILEIGPFAQPVLRSRNVKYFDVMDRAGLAERIQRENITVLKAKNIPEIDFVSPTGDLNVVDQKFDCVVSSHCIEHQPDVVRHLQQVENILTDGGCYFVIVPDKRYCFDHYIEESTLEDVLQSHIEKRTVHSKQNVIKHLALTTHNEPARHWEGDNGEKPNDPERIVRAEKIFEDANGAYIDVHSLFLTPKSFRAIFNALHDRGLTKLKPIRVYDTPVRWNEFCAILQKDD